MTTTRACAFATTLLLALAFRAPAAAQSHPLQPGDSVRVTYGGQRLTGSVIHQGPGTLVIRTLEDEREIPLESVALLERGTRRTRGQQMVHNEVIGALSGAVAGGILGLASGDDENCWICLSATDKAVVGALTLGLAGAATGAVIGAIQTPGLAWRTVLKAPAVTFGHSGVGMGLGVEWTF